MKKNNSWILKGGRIIDPANHIDRTGDLWIKDGTVDKLQNRADLKINTGSVK